MPNAYIYNVDNMESVWGDFAKYKALEYKPCHSSVLCLVCCLALLSIASSLVS